MTDHSEWRLALSEAYESGLPLVFIFDLESFADSDQADADTMDRWQTLMRDLAEISRVRVATMSSDRIQPIYTESSESSQSLPALSDFTTTDSGKFKAIQPVDVEQSLIRFLRKIPSDSVPVLVSASKLCCSCVQLVERLGGIAIQLQRHPFAPQRESLLQEFEQLNLELNQSSSLVPIHEWA